jgi:cytochrome c oxidase assembly protein subunit 15
MPTGLLLLSSHLVVALVALVAIGGATRVMEAGLACPDWPLCYGSFLPSQRMTLQVFLEWFHRLDAFLVGMALLVLTGFSLWRRQSLPRWLPWAAAAALALVALQGALGALTVTELLRFDVVTAHLATALVLVALLSGIHQGLRPPAQPSQLIAVAGPPGWPVWSLASGTAAVLVFAQALSGGLMATRWAAGRCLASGEACSWLGLHRQLATPVALAVIALAAAMLLLPGPRRRLWPFATAAAALVSLQMALGVATLRLALTVPLVTVGHQITAALLIGVLSALTVRAWRDQRALTSHGSASSLSPLETCHG